LALAVLAAGCAPAMPSFTGGRTVPADRSDLALGAAVRVPVGDMVAAPDDGTDADELIGFGAPGGVAPVAFVRHGLTDDVDLGVEAAGSSLLLSLRGQLRHRSGLRLIGGVAPYVGLVHDDGTAVRAGGALPIGIAFDAFSVLEAWLGARIAVEHVTGEMGPDAAAQSASLTGLRAGGVVGIAAGFRRLHVLVELGVDYEHWTGALADSSIERSGVVLTPGFALRLRL
jgi:hypothetical protein